MISELEIKNKVESLKSLDPAYKRFGAAFHHYKFNEVLSPFFVHDFEKKNNIILPTDYLDFLLKVGDGGVGPYYGLLRLMDSIIDFKLTNKPKILVSESFPHTEPWNESWIDGIDWEKERPETLIVNKYMDVSHIYGSLQLCHFGHGCTYLLIVNGKEAGNIWFDGRADYSGIYPEMDTSGNRITFVQWYMQWLNSSLTEPT